MRYWIGVALLFSFCAQMNAGTLPPANVKCGKTATVYNNSSPAATDVVIQVTAGCSTAMVRVTGKSPKQFGLTSAGQTEAFAISVEPQGSISIECGGSGSANCQYSLSVH